MNLNQKDLNRPKNQLQKDCFREFRKWFPDLVSKIEIFNSKTNPEHFCFSIASENPQFGRIILDIDHLEIIVYNDYDHQHFATYYYEDDNDDNLKRQKAIFEALSGVKSLISGNEIIEIERKGDHIIKAFRYHKDNPDNPYSAMIGVLPDDISQRPDPNIPTERILISWNQVINKEIINTAANKSSNAMKAESSKKKEISKSNFWDKLQKWWS